MKFGVVLSGSGVYDGSEIHEAVLLLLAINELGHEYECFAPNIQQHHVVNHLTGEEMEEQRDVLIESARIARGEVRALAEAQADELDALVLPGGFGAAKNLSTWAFDGPKASINEEVKRIINEMVMAGKPIGAVCMGPTVVAKALQESGIQTTLTVGTTEQSSPYDIKGISEGMEATGATAVMKFKDEIAIDKENKIVSAPCYMMDTDIKTIRKNTFEVVDEMVKLV